MSQWIMGLVVCSLVLCGVGDIFILRRIYIWDILSKKNNIRSSEIQILLGALNLYFLIWPP